MAYKEDKDLEFIQYLKDEEIEPLFKCIVYGADSKDSRLTQFLTSSDEYKKYGTQYSKYWKRICQELQEFGGNSFVNLFRGKGVLYSEIVKDVCKRSEIEVSKGDTVRQLEDKILTKIITASFEKMSPEQQREFLKSCNISGNICSEELAVLLLGGGVGGLMLAGFANPVVGAKIICKLIVYAAGKVAGGKGVACLVGKLISLVAGDTIAKAAVGVAIIAGDVLSLFIPVVGTAIATKLTSDITGPAYRVTYPSVVQIAVMRRTYEYNKYIIWGSRKWIVLERQIDRALIISHDAVEKRCFDAVSNDWKNSEIRAYLNGEFYEKNFTDEERKNIIQTKIETEKVITEDYIFLLSADEAKLYFKSNEERICLFEEKPYLYWLRSPGAGSCRTKVVDGGGAIYDLGGVYYDYAVRPALWVNLESGI